jgi:hypothetical protein
VHVVGVIQEIKSDQIERDGNFWKLHERFKLLHIRSALYGLMQKAVILSTCVIVRKYLAQRWIRSVWWWDPYSFENQLNCCEVRKVGDDDDDDDDDDDSNNTSTGNWTLEQRKGPKESNQTVCARICNKVHEPEATGLSHLPLTKLREGWLAFRATVGVNSVDVWYGWEHLSPGAINELPKYVIPSDGVLDYKRKIAS